MEAVLLFYPLPIDFFKNVTLFDKKVTNLLVGTKIIFNFVSFNEKS